MELLFFVLNDNTRLDAVLSQLEESGIRGATVIDSTGMAKVLHHDEEEAVFFGAIRGVLNNPMRAKSSTILMVLEKKEIDVAVAVIENVVGDLNNENVGVVFSVPVGYMKGIKKNNE